MNDRAAYYRNAESWATDPRVQADRSRRVAWTVGGIAVAVAAFEAVALAMLAPLRTAYPITLLVDRQTGYVQALDPNTPQRLGADNALTDAYLAQYVTARENFDRATVQVDYRKVGLWSAGRARTTYLSGMAATNPAGPLQSYPAGTVVIVAIKSVSRLSPGTGLVRFDTQRQSSDGRVEGPRSWISVVRFRYSDAPMSLQDRLVNPLGFQVTGYRRDAEAPPPPPAIASTPPSRAYPAGPAPTAPSPPVVRVIERSSTVRDVVVPARPVRGATAMDRREVPVSNIPMGSPVGPGPGVASIRH